MLSHAEGVIDGTRVQVNGWIVGPVAWRGGFGEGNRGRSPVHNLLRQMGKSSNPETLSSPEIFSRSRLEYDRAIHGAIGIRMGEAIGLNIADSPDTPEHRSGL